jgi:hypothetical protein
MILVALPVLGVLALLELGQSITPPVSIDGTWNVEGAGANQCIIDHRTALPRTMDISQSGRGVRISLNSQAALLDGTVDGATVTAVSEVITMRATVKGEQKTRTLVGSMTIRNCPAVNWYSTREVREAGHR